MRSRGTAHATRAGKEGTLVKQYKELNASIAALRALLAGSDIRSDQRKDVEEAIREAQRLRRKPHATRPDVYRCVRRIVDRLINAFFLN
jgi:hypothetical protein